MPSTHGWKRDTEREREQNAQHPPPPNGFDCSTNLLCRQFARWLSIDGDDFVVFVDEACAQARE